MAARPRRSGGVRGDPGFLHAAHKGVVLMANVKKGQLAAAPEWWRHLRWTKRAFWKRERVADRNEIGTQRKDAEDSERRR